MNTTQPNTETDIGNLGGTFTLPGTSIALHRIGYGAMQLCGPGVYGPPKDEAAAIAVLREAVAAGVNHIDTADIYGPHVVNQIIRKALHPYPAGLTIVTKVGARREPDKSWHGASSPAELTAAVHDNLRNLGVDVLDVVNFRVFSMQPPAEGSIEAQMTVLADLQRKGLIRHLGVSHVTANQVAEARKIAPIVCVQNMYNVAYRGDDALIDDLAAAGIAYVPWFPLGGGHMSVESVALSKAAATLGTTPMQVAQAWLLHRSTNMLLIPGTSSVAHLRENLAAATLKLPADVLADLDAVGGSEK
jgi:pyridoxine 4-dehydrogenase